MDKKKPDFWVVKKTVNGKDLWRTYVGPSGFHADRSCRARYFARTEAISQSKMHPGSKVVPVYCTTRKAEPQTRSRSSAWVLRRLAEGKVIYREQSYGWRAGFLRLNAVRCCVEWRTKGDCGTWVAVSGALSCSGRLFCRIAKPEEIPS